MLLVVVGAPVEALEVELEAPVALGQRLENLDAGGDDFLADAITRDGCDPVAVHRLVLLAVAADMPRSGFEFASCAWFQPRASATALPVVSVPALPPRSRVRRVRSLSTSSIA